MCEIRRTPVYCDGFADCHYHGQRRRSDGKIIGTHAWKYVVRTTKKCDEAKRRRTECAKEDCARDDNYGALLIRCPACETRAGNTVEREYGEDVVVRPAPPAGFN